MKKVISEIAADVVEKITINTDNEDEFLMSLKLVKMLLEGKILDIKAEAEELNSDEEDDDGQ